MKAGGADGPAKLRITVRTSASGRERVKQSVAAVRVARPKLADNGCDAAARACDIRASWLEAVHPASLIVHRGNFVRLTPKFTCKGFK